MAHATKELDLVLLYLLASAPPVAPLPPGEVLIDIPGDEPQARRNPVHQGHLAGPMRLTRRRKTEPHRLGTSSLASSQDHEPPFRAILANINHLPRPVILIETQQYPNFTKKLPTCERVPGLSGIHKRAGNPDKFDRILHWRLADSPSLSEYSQQMMAGAQFNASRNLGEIFSPTLVVHGAEDRYMPLANAVALAESIPNTKLRVLDGAGHLVFIEQAKEVNKEIIAFLKPRKRWRSRIRPAKQQTKRLVERLEEANKKLFSSLKNRKRGRNQSSQRPSAKQETKRSQ